MEIYTSYFAKLRKIPSNIIPIAVTAFLPKAVTMTRINELAPDKNILFKYKQDKDTVSYTEKYEEQLETLDAENIVAKIEEIVKYHNGDSAVLVCYEKSGDFCHRHLIAKWLNNYGYNVSEWHECSVTTNG